MRIFSCNLILAGFSLAKSFFDTIDYQSVEEMAKMSHNVYYDFTSSHWFNTTLDIVIDVSIDNSTVKSYLFTNNENDTAVVVFKGTSLYWDSTTNAKLTTNANGDFTIKSPKSSNDRFNDNLFFSCCFYKQSTLFPNCNTCQEEVTRVTKNTDTCCKRCYQDIVQDPMNYINTIHKIIGVVQTYVDLDNADVYFTGHSLGGMLASVASLMYNKVAFTFEVPGDLNYISLTNNWNRVGHKVYHFGHNADPLFIGKCGMTCSILGYNVNTKCHSGYTCSYDSKTKLGYTESILNHRIEYIIKHIIPNWQGDMPQCIQDTECTDCETWEYV